MSEIPDIVPVSALRQTPADVLRRVRKNRQPVFITVRGRAAAVIVGVGEYRRAEQEREVLKALLKGEKEIGARCGHDLDDVLGGADRLLEK